MRLWRAHGLGNDYLVLETPDPMDPALVRALCDRHRGVGDGILEPVRVPAGVVGPGRAGDPPPHRVRIWNPDGSIAEKSGNGLRIFARWVSDREGIKEFPVWTGSETVRCRVETDEIEIEMGRARLLPPTRFGTRLGLHKIQPVDLGNPHAVLLLDEPLDDLPWREWGEQLERSPEFPNRTNVQFVRILTPDRLEIRIWERGAGETLASGSSACAAVAAMVGTHRIPAGKVSVQMPGGVLSVRITDALDITLRGPVQPVGRIEVDPRWLSQTMGGK